MTNKQIPSCSNAQTDEYKERYFSNKESFIKISESIIRHYESNDLQGRMSAGLSPAAASFAAQSAVLVTTAAAATYSGDIAYSTVTGESLLLNSVFRGNEKLYNTGLEDVQTFVNETDELLHVHVNGEEIISTPDHTFYVAKKDCVNFWKAYRGFFRR